MKGLKTVFYLRKMRGKLDEVDITHYYSTLKVNLRLYEALIHIKAKKEIVFHTLHLYKANQNQKAVGIAVEILQSKQVPSL